MARRISEVALVLTAASVSAAAAAASVPFNGQTFVNKGIVAFGRIPSNFTESTGDTLGGIGSAIALKRNSFRKGKAGTFAGTLIVQPDRGYNIETTIDYQARQHAIDFVLTPYYDSANLSFTDAQKTLSLTYRKTLLYSELFGVHTSGLDPAAVRKPILFDPSEPIANASYKHLTVDAEGLVLNADGTFWVSDEYGPYVHKFNAFGTRIQSIAPPAAILPYINGTLNFTSVRNPDTGRTPNQGFEGLTASADGKALYALLQSATIQDGGTDKTTSRYTRLLAWDVSNPFKAPPLIGEWIVPLPQSKKSKTYAASELHYLSNTTFLVLSRDGNGHGDSDTSSSYKQVDLVSLAGATNIAGSAFDQRGAAVSPGGVLDSSITPVQYTGFVNLIDSTQLARFGLHNGDPADNMLIDSKWEGLALASVEENAYPDDYFLFVGADNDFQTTQGIALGQPYDAGIDVDSQFLVFRVTLPSVARGSAAL